MLETARRGMALAERAGPRPMPAGLPLAMALLLSNERRPRARPAASARRSGSTQADDPWALGPVLIFGIGQAFTWLEDYDRARAPARGRHRAGAGVERPRPAARTGCSRCASSSSAPGRWASAYAAGAEAARLGEETGQLNDKALRALRAGPGRGRARPRGGLPCAPGAGRSSWSSGSGAEILRAYVGRDARLPRARPRPRRGGGRRARGDRAVPRRAAARTTRPSCSGRRT